MSTKYILPIIFFGPAIIVIVGAMVMGIITGIKRTKEKKTNEIFSEVKQYSRKYSELYELALKYGLHLGIPDPYKLTYRCTSKYGFDNDDNRKIILTVAGTEEVKNLYSQLTDNRRHKSAFLKQSISIIQSSGPSISTGRFNYADFSKYEEMLCSQFIDSIKEDVRMMIEVVFTSYKGGIQSFRRGITACYQDIANAYTEENEKEIARIRASIERSKLSAKMRYDVLRRDNMRCVICGRGAKDGVKLHVDHIIPVSKGGKSELNNLRTLCDQCNLGKGNSYDPNGIN